MGHRIICSLVFLLGCADPQSKDEVLPADFSGSEDADTAVDEDIEEDDEEDEEDEGEESDTDGESSDEDDDSNDSDDSDVDESEEGTEVGDDDGDDDDSSGDDGAPEDVIVVTGSGLPATLPPSGSSGTLTALSSVAPSGSIGDINVSIDLDHTCGKDLTAILESPSGTSVVLFDLGSLYVCSSDLEDTVLDDEASMLITGGSAPYTGPHKPTGYLSDFDGENPAGIWELTIMDDTIGDVGTLYSWSIILRLD